MGVQLSELEAARGVKHTTASMAAKAAAASRLGQHAQLLAGRSAVQQAEGEEGGEGEGAKRKYSKANAWKDCTPLERCADCKELLEFLTNASMGLAIHFDGCFAVLKL